MAKTSNNKEMFLKLLSVASSDEIASLINNDSFSNQKIVIGSPMADAKTMQVK